jgi:hypothetical protein
MIILTQALVPKFIMLCEAMGLLAMFRDVMKKKNIHAQLPCHVLIEVVQLLFMLQSSIPSK